MLCRSRFPVVSAFGDKPLDDFDQPTSDGRYRKVEKMYFGSGSVKKVVLPIFSIFHNSASHYGGTKLGTPNCQARLGFPKCQGKLGFLNC